VEAHKDVKNVKVGLVLEKAKYQSLHELLYYTKPFEEATAFVVLNQILEGLKELHSQNVAHLDLKEANVLVCRHNDNKQNTLAAQVPVIFKLADFGIAQKMKKPNSKIQKKAGTRCYMPRE